MRGAEPKKVNSITYPLFPGAFLKVLETFSQVLILEF